MTFGTVLISRDTDTVVHDDIDRIAGCEGSVCKEMGPLAEARVGMETFRVLRAVVVNEVAVDVPILDCDAHRPNSQGEPPHVLKLAHGLCG